MASKVSGLTEIFVSLLTKSLLLEEQIGNYFCASQVAIFAQTMLHALNEALVSLIDLRDRLEALVIDPLSAGSGYIRHGCGSCTSFSTFHLGSSFCTIDNLTHFCIKENSTVLRLYVTDK